MIEIQNTNKDQFRKFKTNDFSLILSGGGALGFYYLGVFKYLEENNLFPKEVVGTSIGAILGSLWSLGYSSEEIFNLFQSIYIKCGNSSDKFSKRARKELKQILENKSFIDTRFDFKCVATHVEGSEIKLFSRESNTTLLESVTAASTLPGKYDPIVINNEKYVDGYFLSNFPIEFSSCNDILGIDVLSSLHLSSFKWSRNPIISKKQNTFNITYRAIFKYIQKDSIQKAKENNAIYLAPEEKTSDIFNFSIIEEKYNLGYQDMKKYFD